MIYTKLKNDQELKKAIKILEYLCKIDLTNFNEFGKKFINSQIYLLGLIIDDYQKQYEIPKSSPANVVKFLLEARNERSDVLLNIFESEDCVIDFLKGNYVLITQEVSNLAKYFNVNPSLFLPEPTID